MNRKNQLRYGWLTFNGDWPKLLQELLGSGMTQLQIAVAVDMSQASISDLYRGRSADTSWRQGNALLRLHAERCPQPHKEAA